jgi:Xaa-Pro dipeptidase
LSGPYRRRTLLVAGLLLLTPACVRRESSPSAEAAWYPEEILSPSDRREDIAVKLTRVTALLRRESLAGVLVSTPANFAWITSGTDNTSAAGTLPVAVFVRDDGRTFLIGDGHDLQRISREDVDGAGCERRALSWQEATPDRLEAEALALAGGRAYGTDTQPGTDARFVDLATLRVPLTGFEIREYRWLGKRSAEVLDGICRRVQPGMTERGIEALLSAGLTRHAIRPVGVRVAADKRAEDFGLAPASEKTKVETSVLIGVTASRWGLTTRLARQVWFGSPGPDVGRASAAVSAVTAGYWARTLPGATAGAIVAGAAEDYARAGFAPDRVLPGGAIGYLERDWLARAGSVEPVRSGQTFAWNAWAGPAAAEDTILVAGDQLEVLTEIRGWPVNEAPALGRVYRTPGILVR